MRVAAWRVQDSGLVAAPGPFRRLAGSRVRHLRGNGPVWPVRVLLDLDLDGDELRAFDATDIAAADADRALVGRWRRGDVSVRRVSAGPPVQFVLELSGEAQLLAAAAEPDTEAFLAALSPVLG